MFTGSKEENNRIVTNFNEKVSKKEVKKVVAKNSSQRITRTKKVVLKEENDKIILLFNHFYL